MEQQNLHFQEENDLQKLYEQISRHYKLFIIGIVTTLSIAFAVNKYAIPVYNVNSSILVKENQQQQKLSDVLNTNLFGTNKNLQNELLSIQSSPVISQAVTNLDLPVCYYRRKGFQFIDAYDNVPFKIMYPNNHIQPIGAKFKIEFLKNNKFKISLDAKNVTFFHFAENEEVKKMSEWKFERLGEIDQLIETPELSFIVKIDSTKYSLFKEEKTYYFDFTPVEALTQVLKSQIDFSNPDKKATVIQLSMKTTSIQKGIDILNSIVDVYSNMNLQKKNHLATITIDFIDKQLGEISDSLSKTEQKLQSFRASNQLLDVKEQSSGISSLYVDLQNQYAEILTKKRYYESILSYFSKNDDYTNLMVPASLGIEDPINNNLMGELIAAQSQKNNLIANNQEKNPLVKRLTIQIENLTKTISENIANVLKTNEISLDELDKRIKKLEAAISKMPGTERQLTGIERKFRLDDAIFNYLMQKRAEANITKASNLPDMEVIESAKAFGAVFPNKKMNYILAFILGIAIPFGFVQLKYAFNTKIFTQEQIERITDVPVLGKILHNSKKTNNVVFEFPNSNTAESYRALRTNFEFYVRGGHKKVILVTSCIEGEGKSFNALNIAMSYAQLGRKTILIDFDLRKNNSYFSNIEGNLIGTSSYLINKATLEDIIIQSPHPKLDYIPSGPIPPNPVELIGLEKTEKMINHLKEIYEYIIIDTPPMAQVTDAYLLIEQADVKVIVLRCNYTLKKVFTFIMKDLKLKNISNTCIVLNDNRVYRDQYGYGYGYYNKKAK